MKASDLLPTHTTDILHHRQMQWKWSVRLFLQLSSCINSFPSTPQQQHPSVPLYTCWQRSHIGTCQEVQCHPPASSACTDGGIEGHHVGANSCQTSQMFGAFQSTICVHVHVGLYQEYTHIDRCVIYISDILMFLVSKYCRISDLSQNFKPPITQFHKQNVTNA